MFIGPFEHHSNELPWRESIADVVTIHEDADGHVDLAQLEAELLRHADRPLKIGSFSAASNVTGILSDTRAISVLLHRHGALSFWDFAAAAPYVKVEMSPHRPGPDPTLDYKDAIFLSPHKFIGGPGTPGVLVARRELFRNRVPAVVGRRHGPVRQPGGARLPGRPGASRGGRHAGDPRSRSAPGWSSSSRSGSASRPSARARNRSSTAPSSAGRRIPTSRSWATGAPSGCRSCRSWSATGAGTCTTTSWWRCSTTCSASSRAAAARAPGRTATGCSGSTWRPRASSSARSPAAARASSPAGCG